jgi:serine/threonine protein kinase
LTGRYTPIRRLGSGGMGDVFLSREHAEDGLTRRVALKRIRPELARDRDFRELFLHEARVAIRLTHPNIVHVYDVAGPEGELYVAMEYVDGRSLHDVMQQSGRLHYLLPMEVTMAVGLDVARGLHYAHEERDDEGQPLEIVHRYLTPKSIIISLEGAAKILDFGIARGGLPAGEEDEPEFIGDPCYLSPEQARLEMVDRRSDIYSLGIVLWEMTTGRRLFKVDDALHALEVIGRIPIPSPGEFRPVPPGWEGVLRRALAPEREERYPTARALQLDIEDVARSAGYLVSNIPVVGTLAALFPEVALDLEPPPPLRQRRPTVLVVDDEVHMRELIARTLRRSFEVKSAASVADAMEMLAAAPCDVVLTDERMPEARGLELLTHVARHSPRTLRIMITAFADTELMLQAINDGHVHRFVVKPFRPVDLLALLEEAIAQRPRLVELPSGGAGWDDITSNRPPREEEEITDVGLRAPAGAALPWESLRHLVAPIREDALSSVLMVGMSDQPFDEETRGAIEWVLGSLTQTYWVHTEDRAVAIVLPGVAPVPAAAVVNELRRVLSDAREAEVSFAMAELAATDDLAVMGRQIEDAALELWRTEHAR